MRRLQARLVENADWLAVASLVLWFATVVLLIGGFTRGQFPNGSTLAAGIAYVVGLASGAFARANLTDGDRRIATTALGLYVGASVVIVFAILLPFGVEGT